MKLVGFAIALSLALGGTAAVAHDRYDRHRHEQRYERHRYEPRYEHRERYRHYKPRKTWRHANSRWERHIYACQRRYRHYNPRTDRYLTRHGQWKRCRL